MPTAERSACVIITIDGPAGTGKSTVAHQLAACLGLDFLDTGAMYRASALVAIEQGIDPTDGPALAEAVRAHGLHFDWSADPPRMMLGDRDVSGRIREQDVGRTVSIVAGQPELRALLVEQQRRIGEDRPRLVSEGRDQGSVVFPEAGLRFFLDADIETRADRRMAQCNEAGIRADRDTVLREIRERDRLDSTRSHGPLVRPPGAVVVDTSNRTRHQVVEELQRLSRARFPETFSP